MTKNVNLILEIYARGDTGDRVVATIELLSISNKTAGDKGRELYLKKQQEIQESTVHLVEIDLLRGGQHATAVPREWLVRKAVFDYHICVTPGDIAGEYFAYPFRLSERMPEIAIPLLSPTPPVVIDLQQVFERCYDVGPYRRSVRYGDRLLRDKRLAGST